MTLSLGTKPTLFGRQHDIKLVRENGLIANSKFARSPLNEKILSVVQLLILVVEFILGHAKFVVAVYQNHNFIIVVISPSLGLKYNTILSIKYFLA